jgi:hypothetical protein
MADIELIDAEDIPYGFIPYKINNKAVKDIPSSSPESVKIYARKLIADGWKIYAVDQDRGRCYSRAKVITIPTWVIRIGGTKLCWYFCHEMAHAYNYIDGTCDSHGPNFMLWLKQICPENCIEHELGYKPRNAAAAGIGKSPFLEL